MMMGPEPRIRIFEMSFLLGIRYAILVLFRKGTPTGASFSATLLGLSSRAKRGTCSSVFSPQPSAKSCHAGFADFDQRRPLRARPRFDLLLAGDRVPNVPESLVIHQPINVVLLRESLKFSALMLQCTLTDIVRHTRINVQ